MERQCPWHPFRLPGLCGLRGTSCVLMVVTLLIVLPLFWWDIQQAKTSKNQTHHEKRSYSFQSDGWCSQKMCRWIGAGQNRQVNVTCKVGEDCIIKLDQCQVADCQEQNNNQEPHVLGTYLAKSQERDCHNRIREATIVRMTRSEKNCVANGCNPVLFTLKNPGCANETVTVITLNSQGQATGVFVILVLGNNQTAPDWFTKSDVEHKSNLTLRDKLAIETGFNDENEWIKWMEYTVKNNGQSNCIACAKARPLLGIVPFTVKSENDLTCMIQAFDMNHKPNNELCKALRTMFPSIRCIGTPPGVQVYPGNYTCFLKRGGGWHLGRLGTSYCHITHNVTTDSGAFKTSWFKNHTAMRADLWWMCGDKKLRPKLPVDWQGAATLAFLHVSSFRPRVTSH